MLFQLKNNGLSKKPPIELAKNNHRPNYVNLHKMNLGRRRNQQQQPKPQQQPQKQQKQQQQQ
ncbi:hypothetical protein T03_1079 [Trichinella britovi]|uniref:Uncharacterized protein n=1 Tax=Trichinella britovi TaxID=45882 RepID=A0A0V1CIF4_TRIBR|nr:hypothetical protein T03_1079 [Trichinella britovi]